MAQLSNLALSQQDIYYDQMLHPGKALYNIGGKAAVRGKIDPGLFGETVRQLVAQHDSLRSVVCVKGGVPYLNVLEHVETGVTYHDFSAGTQPAHAADQFISQEFARSFNLDGSELLNQFFLLKVSDELFYIFAKFHHLVVDGWSISLVFTRLSKFYTNIRCQQPVGDGEVYPYVDFVADDLAYLASGEYVADRRYWKDKTAAFDAGNALFQRNTFAVSETGGSLNRQTVIERQKYDQIRAFCTGHGVSVFHFLLGIVYAYFSQASGKDAFITGLPTLNRKNKKFKKTIGLFTGITPLLLRVDREASFTDLLQSIRNELKENYRHQRLPLSTIATDAGWTKDGSESFLPVFFSYEKHDYSIPFDGSPADIYPVSHHLEQSPIAVYVREFDDAKDVRIDFNYQPAYCEDAFVSRLPSLIDELLADPTVRIGSLRVVSPAEEAQLLEAFNDTALDVEAGLVLATLFERQVALTPHKIALECGPVQLTYGQLDERANRLAWHLRQDHQVGPDQLVGLMLSRSEHMVTAILGVLKAGGAYLPVDPEHPQARTGHILHHSQVRLLVSDAGHAPALEQMGYATVVLQGEGDGLSGLSHRPPVVNRPEDLAYVMYTSGSTGQPKGVEITHGSVVNFLLSMQRQPAITSRDRLLAVTTCAFDISVLELLLPLVSGAQLVVLERERILDNQAFARSIAHYRPTLLQATPALWQMLLEAGWQGDGGLRALCGGERLGGELGERLGGKVKELWNMYGPTETTIWSTLCRVQGNVPSNGPAEGSPAGSIGRPIANTQVYILNGRDQLQPVGLAGEICIGGAGLARGYRLQPQLTAQRFVDVLLGGTTRRVYRTGDLGKWDSQGRIIFLGRKDEQVKVRGYRVEPGEVEQALLAHEKVKAAAVVAYQSEAGTSLAAYVVLSGPLPGRALLEHLRGRLPHYMLPSRLVALAQLPLSANGKVDKKRLSEQAGSDLLEEVQQYEPAATALQGQLAELWQGVLGRERVGMQDNFFELGGHSLRAVQILSRLRQQWGVEVGLHELFSHPTLAALSRLVEERLGQTGGTGGTGAESPSIPVTARAGHYPVSHAQRRLWILSQRAEGSLAYNISGLYRLQGELDEESFGGAFDALLARHESLRTVFGVVQGVPVQRVVAAGSAGWALAVEDLRGVARAGEVVEERARLALETAFDLESGPLVRAGLLRTGPQTYYLLLTMHHIITDGWSMEVMVRELIAFYNAGRRGQWHGLLPLRIQYRDYAQWQNQQLEGGRAGEHRAYWLARLGGAPVPLLNLPTDFPRPETQSFRGDLLEYQCDPQVSDSLRSLGRQHQASTFMTLSALFKVLLYRYTEQPDLIVGTPVSGREHQDTHDQVGFFVNMVALRTNLNQEDSFLSVLAKEKEAVLGALLHQAYPFDKLVEELNLPRDMSRSPLFNVTVAMEPEVLMQDRITGADGLLMERVKRQHVVSKYDLSLTFRDQGPQLGIAVEYNTALYRKDTVARLLQHFVRVLETVAADPTVRIGSLRVVSPAEEAQLLEAFNDTALDVEAGLVLSSLFERQVALTPHKIALECGPVQLTYGQLDERANRLAWHLRQDHQVGPDQLVGLMLSRSEHMVTAILGVLKAGGAYLPVDPEHPQARTGHILHHSQVRLLVSDAGHAPALEQMGYATVVLQGEGDGLSGLSHRPPVVNRPEDLAYVMYTSGSTGQPKGVEITHGSVVNFLLSMQRQPAITSRDRLLAVTTCAFDISVLELLLPLVSGAQLVVLERERILDNQAFARSIAHYRPTLLQATPALWQMLLEAGWQGDGGLRALCGGERLGGELGERLGGKVKELWNMYGPTETTIWSTLCRVQGNVVSSNPAEGNPAGSIGRPIANTQVYILNGRDQLQPVGLAGEICIGGAGLARGYRLQPQLTAQRFVDVLLGGTTRRVYRTGDLGKWDSQGRIIFLGRKDEQVKVRGYRVEPGEVEQALLAHEQVKAAAVVAYQSEAGTSLAAYVVLSGPLPGRALLEHLRGRLPHYMLPSRLVALAQLPLSANGKVDKKRLFEQAGSDLLEEVQQYEPAATALQGQLAELWQGVLGRERVGMQDNFFELGGHSLRAVQILSRLRQQWGVEVGLHELFSHPTLAALSRLVEERLGQTGGTGGTGAESPSIPVTARAGHYPVSHAQRRLWILSQRAEGSLAYNISGLYRLQGELDEESFGGAFDALLARHESLRTVFGVVQGVPVQRVVAAGSAGWALAVEDLRGVARAGEVVEERARLALETAFDLESGPLVRAGLLRTGPQTYYLLLTMHHIITDGWSMEVMVRELIAFYNAGRRGQWHGLLPLRIQYRDYAQWQNQQLEGGRAGEHRAYWLARLGGVPVPLLNLPTDFPRPDVLSHRGGVVSGTIDRESYLRLTQLANQYDSSLYTVLMGLSKVLLFSLTGQSDIIVGYPVSLRDHVELENQIGFYLNTVALRTTVTSADTFAGLLQRVREGMLTNHQHLLYPFDKVVADLGLARSTARAPLFDVVVVLQNLQVHKEGLGDTADLLVEHCPLELTPSAVDLRFEFIEREDWIDVNFDYNKGLFKAETVRVFLDRFLSLVSQVPNDPAAGIGDILYGNDKARAFASTLDNYFNVSF